jgi:transcription factor SPN1
MDDPDLDPIDETAKPVLSDSELSDVDEEAYAGIDTDRIGLSSDDEEEGPSVFALRPAKLKTGTGERKKKQAEDTAEKRRKRQERRQEKEEHKKRRAARDETPDDIQDEVDPNQRPEDPEAARRWDLDRAMESAISRKPVKRRKKDDDIVTLFSDDFTDSQDIEALEEDKIKALKRSMEEAADKDFDAIKNKMPATHKLAMLPTVESVLAKSALHETLLDNLILMTLRRWLEPLPDRSLPAYSIQRTLLAALQKLPITKEHLAESGIGKIIIFYRNSPRVEQAIRRVADTLWVEWSRPILRKSANFRDRQIATANYNPSMALPVLKNSGGEDPRRTVMAHTIHSTFEIAPRATLDLSNVPAARGNRTENNDMFKRLRMKMQNAKIAKTKKEGAVSIQGGGR